MTPSTYHVFSQLNFIYIDTFIYIFPIFFWVLEQLTVVVCSEQCWQGGVGQARARVPLDRPLGPQELCNFDTTEPLRN